MVDEADGIRGVTTVLGIHVVNVNINSVYVPRRINSTGAKSHIVLVPPVVIVTCLFSYV